MNLQTLLDFIKKNLVLVALGIIVVLGGLKLLDSFNENKRLHEDLIGKEEAFKKISDYAASLKIQYKDQDSLKAEVEKNWKAEKSYLKGRIKILSNATYLIREKARAESKSDITYVGTKLKFVVNEIRMGDDGPPIGYVLIFDDGRVVSKVYNHEIDVKTAVSRDEESGKYDVISKADYILKSPSLGLSGNWYDKPYPLKIIGGTALIDPTEPNQTKHFYFWAPRLNANFNASQNGVAPGLGVSTMGYGYSKRDLDLRLLQIGAQYDKNRGPGVTFTPLLYRPFSDALPNTYIGPGVAVDKYGYGYFLGIQIGF